MPRAHGFTLVEMLVVLAVVGLIIASSSALFRAPRSEPARLRQAAREMVAELRHARAKAVFSSKALDIEISVAEQRYRSTVGDWRVPPEGVRLSLPDMPERETATLSFHPDGGSSGIRIALSLARVAKEIEVGALTGSVTARE